MSDEFNPFDFTQKIVVQPIVTPVPDPIPSLEDICQSLVSHNEEYWQVAVETPAFINWFIDQAYKVSAGRLDKKSLEEWFLAHAGHGSDLTGV